MGDGSALSIKRQGKPQMACHSSWQRTHGFILRLTLGSASAGICSSKAQTAKPLPKAAHAPPEGPLARVPPSHVQPSAWQQRVARPVGRPEGQGPAPDKLHSRALGNHNQWRACSRAGRSATEGDDQPRCMMQCTTLWLTKSCSQCQPCMPASAAPHPERCWKSPASAARLQQARKKGVDEQCTEQQLAAHGVALAGCHARTAETKNGRHAMPFHATPAPSHWPCSSRTETGLALSSSKKPSKLLTQWGAEQACNQGAWPHTPHCLTLTQFSRHPGPSALLLYICCPVQQRTCSRRVWCTDCMRCSR